MSQIQLHHGDSIDWMQASEQEFDLIFADPPYGQDFDYGPEVDDCMTDYQYRHFARNWVAEAIARLKPDGSLVIVISDSKRNVYENAAREVCAVFQMAAYWHYEFGVYQADRFAVNHTPMLWFSRGNPKFYPDAIRIKSERLQRGDPRANPRGKIPGSVWSIPRLAGTHKERIKGAPTQLPLELVRRWVLALTQPGDWVLDPFLGTGTTGVVCAQEGRNFVGVEKTRRWFDVARQRIGKGGKENCE